MRGHPILSPAVATLAAAMLTLGSAGAAVAQQDAPSASPRSAAVFGFTLVDSSTEGALHGPREDETRRIEMLDAQLRAGLAASSLYRPVETTPAVAAKAQTYAAMYDCNRCDAALARELGAEVAVTGMVQKVSNLILNINVYVRDARTGELISGASADIRGNTDRSWSRGLDWLLRNRILKTP